MILVFTIVHTNFHFLCVTERVQLSGCSTLFVIPQKIIAFLEGNEAYEPVQLEAYSDTIFI